MKTLTMVMRSGEAGEQSKRKSYILIAEDYSVVHLTEEELIKAIVNNKYNITNLDINQKGVVSTNGAIEKYTFINSISNMIEGKASPVVLNRIEKNKDLVGYTIFTTDGLLQEVSVSKAVNIHAKTPFSNGKLRHTQDEDIISSITGNYPLRIVNIQSKKAGDIKVDLVFMGSAIGNENKPVYYAGILINCDNASNMTNLWHKIANSNSKLIKEIEALGGDDSIHESLKIRRTGSAGIYGVFPLDVVTSIIGDANNRIRNRVGSIAVSCIDYVENKESSVLLSRELKVIMTIYGSSERATKVVQKYYKSVIKMLEGVTIED